MSSVVQIKYRDVSPDYLAEEREIFLPLEYKRPRLYTNSCRYKNLRRIQDEDTKKVFHESWNQNTVGFSDSDAYFTVTSAEENRLDIIANNYYGTAKYWWVIALANYIIDPFDIPIGTQLRIPPLISLYEVGGVLSGS